MGLYCVCVWGGFGRVGGGGRGRGPRQSSGSDPIEFQFAAVPGKDRPEPQIEQTERKGIGESQSGPGTDEGGWGGGGEVGGGRRGRG